MKPTPERPAAGSVAAWCALALVTWQGTASAWDDISELRLWSWDAHRFAFGASPDERMRLALEDDYELWRAVRENVPAERRLLVSYPANALGPRLFERMQHLRTLRCPVGLKGLPYDARHPIRGEGAGIVEEYVLDLESGRDYSSHVGTEELAHGQGFQLLLVRREPR